MSRSRLKKPSRSGSHNAVTLLYNTSAFSFRSSRNTSMLRCLVVLSLVSALFGQSTSPPAMMGFTAEATRAQAALEARFDAALKADNLRDWLKRLSARPHHLGSAYNKENADFIAAQFRSWGYDTKLEEFHVLFPTPKTRIVQMTSPERFTLKLNEPPVEGDATSAQQSEQLPTYNAYSKIGRHTSELQSPCNLVCRLLLEKKKQK